MATSLTPESAVSACSAAPVPRPPQPTRPTLIVLLPAACTRGTVKPVETAVAVAAATRAVEPLMNSRRERGRRRDWRLRSAGVLRLRSVSHGRSSLELINDSRWASKRRDLTQRCSSW